MGGGGSSAGAFVGREGLRAAAPFVMDLGFSEQTGGSGPPSWKVGLAFGPPAPYVSCGRFLRETPMNTPAQPELVPGRAYRTRDLRPWSANPTRLARRLVDEGKLREAAHGLYYAPVVTRFGAGPATDEELLRAFLGGERFLVTGPPFWNALGLGSTAMFAVTLVYNTRRSGEFQLGGRRFLLRRVYFPEKPTVEWFIVDLLQHHDMAGAGISDLRAGLVATLRAGRWDRERLRAMAQTYGTKATLAVVDDALRESERAA
jgi:hypothetical protein